MSSSIWTECAGASELRALQLAPWRVVEAQHIASTRKLVDSAAEQDLLETLIDGVKPPSTVGGTLHYLLSTPFRYPPLRHGSRFGSRLERGIWYGSEQQRTAFAEVAYYRLLFLEGTRAALDRVVASLTAFTVRVRTMRGVDLFLPPFDAYREVLASPHSYAATQALGRAMRADGVELVRFVSARDVLGGANVAAFTPAVFHKALPQHAQRWHCTATRDVVDFVRTDLLRAREFFEFARGEFVVDGRVPLPSA